MYATFIRISFFICLFTSMVPLQGCNVVKTTKDTVKVVGKVGWETARAPHKVVVKTTRLASKGLRSMVYIVEGKQTIPLEKQGNRFMVKVKLNKKMDARFLIDTGADHVKANRSLMNKLGVDLAAGADIMVRGAGGKPLVGKVVSLDDVQLAPGVGVSNVQTIVLATEKAVNYDGLLGMSFFNHFNFQIDTERSVLILQELLPENVDK